MNEGILKSLPIIETDRLILRNFGLEDTNSYFRYHNNPDAIMYYDWKPCTLADAKEDIKLIIANYEQLNFIRWAVTTKENDDIIGDCGLIIGELKAEISYMLANQFWGSGIMAEALSSLISYCFEHTDLLRIQALCHPENHRSVNLLKKLGLRNEGLLRKYGYNAITNNYDDLLMWSILREELKNHATYKVTYQQCGHCQ